MIEVSIYCQDDWAKVTVPVESGEDAEGACPVCGGHLFVSAEDIEGMMSAHGVAGFVRCVVEPDPGEPEEPPEPEEGDDE